MDNELFYFCILFTFCNQKVTKSFGGANALLHMVRKVLRYRRLGCAPLARPKAGQTPGTINRCNVEFFKIIN